MTSKALFHFLQSAHFKSLWGLPVLLADPLSSTAKVKAFYTTYCIQTGSRGGMRERMIEGGRQTEKNTEHNVD